MSPATDTFDRDLRDVLHAAVDGTSVPLGVPAPVLVARAARAARRRAAWRVTAAAAAALLVASGVWLGLVDRPDVRPAGPTTTATMVIGPAQADAGSGGPTPSPGTGAVLGVAPVVETDSQSIVVLDGAGSGARTLGRIPFDEQVSWTLSGTDPRLRVGVIPNGATLASPWNGQWTAQTALTQLDDGRYVYVDAFPTAADATAAVGVVFTDHGGVTLTTGATLPSVTRVLPRVELPSETISKTVFVDVEGRQFGVHDDLVGGPLGPLVATGDGGVSHPIAADGAGASLTTEEDPNLPEQAAYLVGVLPSEAADIRLATKHGPLSMSFVTAPIPGTAYQAFWAQQDNPTGPVPLAKAVSLSWTDPGTGERHTHAIR